MQNTQSTPPPSPCRPTLSLSGDPTDGSLHTNTTTTGNIKSIPKSRKKTPQRALVLSPSEKKDLKIITLDVYGAYARNPLSLFTPERETLAESNSGNELNASLGMNVEKKVSKKGRKRKKYSDIEGKPKRNGLQKK